MENKIHFENNQGKVTMFLGGNGPVRVTALSGLGSPEKKYETVTFAGKSGQKTLSSVAQARTVIISGDIFGGREVTENLIRILDEPGTLEIEFGDKRRKIFCSQVNFSEGVRHGGYTSFVLSLTADGAYFTDVNPTEISIFQRRKMLDGDIVFPCVLTEKTTQADADNFGEVNVEPIISICNYHDQGSPVEGSIVIENLTTNQKITLETGMEENETITVDIENRTVSSSVRGTVTHLISDDTFLNRFWLAPGRNNLRASHGNEGEEISVALTYYSNYREGVF
ncbi:MAG: hypothetical protein WCX81_03355 [Monoglobales bacterium]